MSKITEILQSIKNFRNNNVTVKHKQNINNNNSSVNDKKDSNIDNKIETEKDDESKNDTIDNKTDKPNTKTVNKSRMIQGVLFLTAFLAAVTFGATYGSDNKPKAKDIETATTLDNSLNKEIKGDDYETISVKKAPKNPEDLSMYENAKNHKLKPEGKINNIDDIDDESENNNRNKTNSNRQYASNNNNNGNYSRPVPILNERSNSPNMYNPYMNTVTPYAMSRNFKTEIPNENKTEQKNSKKEDTKNAFESAIAFISDITEGHDNNSNENNTNSSVENNTEETLMSYVAPSPNTLQAGTYIPMILLNGINSQTGGQIMAQIQTDMYDSYNGENVLIPMGARLVGEYENGAKQGQDRVNINWKHLIMPDGYMYNIEGVFQTSDSNGYPGIPGYVNNHNGSKISAGMVSSALAALGSIATGNNSYGNDYGWHDSGQLAMQGASANLLNTASSIFKQKLDIEPEITVDPGTTFYVYLTQPISF